MTDPTLLLTGVLALGVAAQWLAWRLRLPAILLLLAFGFIAGNVFHIDPDVVVGRDLLFHVVSLSVAVILFEGGLTLSWNEIQESTRALVRLVTLGVIVSWVLTTGVCIWVAGMAPGMAALLGAVLVVTGPTVIGPLLRHVRPVKRVGSVAKWEGIVVDPIGAVLAVLVFEVVARPDSTVATNLFRTIVSGVGIGGLSALLMIQFMRRYWIPDFLHNAVFLAVALVTYALSNAIQPESGLLTVTVLGICLANQRSVPIRHVVEFKENLRVLLISCLFVILAARIRLEALAEVKWEGLGLLVISILVIRPVSVLLVTIGTRLNKNERLFLAFLAPRGIVAAAVSSVFALEVHHVSSGFGEAGDAVFHGAEKIVPLTFVMIVGTVTFYGLIAGPLARYLQLSSPNPQGVLFAGASPWTISLAKLLQDSGFSVVLVDTNYTNTAAARMAGVPTACASIVSEYVQEDLDLGGIGRLLAVTANDDLNSLAALEFTHLFGRREVYQLVPGDLEAKKRANVSRDIRGRQLFATNLTHDRLVHRFATGAQIKKTKLSVEFTFEDFQREHGLDAVPLFLIDDGQRLTVCTCEQQISPKAGQTVIALVGGIDPELEIDNATVST